MGKDISGGTLLHPVKKQCQEELEMAVCLLEEQSQHGWVEGPLVSYGN